MRVLLGPGNVDMSKLIKVAASWLVRSVAAGRSRGLLAYMGFLALSGGEFVAWALIALEVQWAESFLTSLALSSASHTILSVSHHVVVVSTMMSLQSRFSDGPLGIALRALGFDSAIPCQRGERQNSQFFQRQETVSPIGSQPTTTLPFSSLVETSPTSTRIQKLALPRRRIRRRKKAKKVKNVVRSERKKRSA